jgi:hypothetical protein
MPETASHVRFAVHSLAVPCLLTAVTLTELTLTHTSHFLSLSQTWISCIDPVGPLAGQVKVGDWISRDTNRADSHAYISLSLFVADLDFLY